MVTAAPGISLSTWGSESPSRRSVFERFFPDLVGGDNIPGYPEQAHEQARPL